jgi:hypothetical protein
MINGFFAKSSEVLVNFCFNMGLNDEQFPVFLSHVHPAIIFHPANGTAFVHPASVGSIR